MDEKRIKKISKFLSYVLRHHPESIGIELDRGGWAEVDTLIAKSKNHGMVYSLDTLKYVVDNNSKKRFAFNEKQDKIRASQGHSIDIDLGYTNQRPPQMLYHGTAEAFVPSIFEKGLEKRSRQHVHLSTNALTAKEVGARHGKPSILLILAEQMYEDQYEFFLSENGVWLTDHVPPQYIKKH